MDIRAVLKSQYHAALTTLRLDVEQCPDEMWADPADWPAPFWRVAYHTLFYRHFYSLQDQGEFEPWAKNWRGAETLEGIPSECPEAPRPFAPYWRAEVREYWHCCDERIDAAVDSLDLEAAQCGFPFVQDGDAGTSDCEHPPYSASCGDVVGAAAQGGWHRYWLGGERDERGRRKWAAVRLVPANLPGVSFDVALTGLCESGGIATQGCALGC
jgi:hypothetical protein